MLHVIFVSYTYNNVALAKIGPVVLEISQMAISWPVRSLKGLGKAKCLKKNGSKTSYS